jgi:hypothetical protein
MMNLVTLVTLTLAARALAWDDSVMKLYTGAKTLTEAEVAARKWGPITEGFQLSVAADKETYRLGNPVVMSVLVRNVSGRPLGFTQSDPQIDYDVECVGSDGKIAPLTTYGQRFHGSESVIIHAGGVRLKPAESFEHVLPLDKLYDVSRVGMYNVTVTRKVPKENAPKTNGPPQFAEIKSNTIRVTLLRPD